MNPLISPVGRIASFIGCPPEDLFEDSGRGVVIHWTGLSLAYDTEIYDLFCPHTDVCQEAFLHYLHFMPPEEKTRRRGLFDAMVKADAFFKDFYTWVRRRMTDPTDLEEKQKYFQGWLPGMIITQELFTSAIPAALHEQFARSAAAKKAWRDFLWSRRIHLLVHKSTGQHDPAQAHIVDDPVKPRLLAHPLKQLDESMKKGRTAYLN